MFGKLLCDLTILIKRKNRVGLAEMIAYNPDNQVNLGSNPTRGNRLKSDP